MAQSFFFENTMKNTMKNSTRLIAAAVIFVLGIQRADAAIVVNVSNLLLAPNATGTIDITISSDSDDPLQFYSLDLLITRFGSSTLQFGDPQSESHLTDSNYIFDGDTFGGGAYIVDTTADANDTLIAASDFTDSGDDVIVPGAPTPPDAPTLLYRLNVQHFEDALNPGNLGDTFTISVTGFDFQDSTFTSYDPMDLTFNSGTVTIGSSTAVPEPSSLALTALASLTLAGRRFWRRRLSLDHTM
jgi:hypothetical protein